MFRNYFNVAWRNLQKNKLYSFINIGGLAVGICICMLIMLYVAHERSYDKFHKNADRIFFPTMKLHSSDKEIVIDRLSYSSPIYLKDADPGIESFLRIQPVTGHVVIQNLSNPEIKFREQKVILADSNFFNFFSFRLIAGNAENVLKRPFTIVMSEAAAIKYFGNTNPVGKSLRYDNQHVFEITGVAANPPSNSSIDYDFIISSGSIPGMSNEPEVSTGKFEPGNFKTYFLLNKGVNPSRTAKTIQRLAGTGQSNEKFKYELNPLYNQRSLYGRPSNLAYIKIYSWTAGLILLLALINYMSLATAQSALRSAEVAVRKVLGAGRRNLVKQFYTESTLFTCIAVALGLLLFYITRNSFYELMGFDMDETFVNSPAAWVILATLFIISILISGSYPSLVLSSFTPVKVLYGKLSRQKAGYLIRKFFTVFQFTISVTLIISSIIINRQLEFFQQKDTGVHRDQVIMIPFGQNINKHYLAFKEQISQIPGIQGVATAGSPMFGGIDMTVAKSVNSPGNTFISQMFIDQKFIPMLGIQWKLPPTDLQTPTRQGQVVINEETINRLNLPANPVGNHIIVAGDSLQIAGVVKNFNYASLHHKIDALCLLMKADTDSAWYADNGDCLFVKSSSFTNIASTIESIRKIHSDFDKENPFEYHFLDEAFDALYKAEQRLENVFKVFTIITIVIACLGLFSLAAFSATQRTKEIGIRKVLGADVMSILRIMSANFMKPVYVAILIAIPLAGILMDIWLQDFAYRIQIKPWMFIVAAVGAITIAFMTVVFHAVKTAWMNPVKSLRS